MILAPAHLRPLLARNIELTFQITSNEQQEILIQPQATADDATLTALVGEGETKPPSWKTSNLVVTGGD